MKVETSLKAGATYPDMSGYCGTSTTPPTTSGATYPDYSGYCGTSTTPPAPVPPIASAYPDMSGYCG